MLPMSVSHIPTDECEWVWDELRPTAENGAAHGGELASRGAPNHGLNYENPKSICKPSNWHPDSLPRILEDHRACGGQSYYKAAVRSCRGAPTSQVLQPGHGAFAVIHREPSGKWVNTILNTGGAQRINKYISTVTTFATAKSDEVGGIGKDRRGPSGLMDQLVEGVVVWCGGCLLVQGVVVWCSGWGGVVQCVHARTHAPHGIYSHVLSSPLGTASNAGLDSHVDTRLAMILYRMVNPSEGLSQELFALVLDTLRKNPHNMEAWDMLLAQVDSGAIADPIFLRSMYSVRHRRLNPTSPGPFITSSGPLPYLLAWPPASRQASAPPASQVLRPLMSVYPQMIRDFLVAMSKRFTCRPGLALWPPL